MDKNLKFIPKRDPKSSKMPESSRDKLTEKLSCMDRARQRLKSRVKQKSNIKTKNSDSANAKTAKNFVSSLTKSKEDIAGIQQ